MTEEGPFGSARELKGIPVVGLIVEGRFNFSLVSVDNRANCGARLVGGAVIQGIDWP